MSSTDGTVTWTEHMVTTEDNPFDPFDEFDEWYTWDERSGYHTLSLLGRLLFSSDELSDAQQERVYNQVIDEIVHENITGVYKKVSRMRTDRSRAETI